MSTRLSKNIGDMIFHKRKTMNAKAAFGHNVSEKKALKSACQILSSV